MACHLVCTPVVLHGGPTHWDVSNTVDRTHGCGEGHRVADGVGESRLLRCAPTDGDGLLDPDTLSGTCDALAGGGPGMVPVGDDVVEAVSDPSADIDADNMSVGPGVAVVDPLAVGEGVTPDPGDGSPEDELDAEVAGEGGGVGDADTTLLGATVEETEGDPDRVACTGALLDGVCVGDPVGLLDGVADVDPVLATDKDAV